MGSDGKENLIKAAPAVGNGGGQNKNTFLTKETIQIRKAGHSHIIEALDRFGNMTLDQLKDVAEMSGSLTAKDAMMLKVWQKILEKGDMRHIKAVLAIYGIATEIKSIHYSEVDDAYRTQDPQKIKDVTPIPMSSKERVEMLQKMIEIEQNRASRK